MNDGVFETVVNGEARPSGDVVPALARLLVNVAKKEEVFRRRMSTEAGVAEGFAAGEMHERAMTAFATRAGRESCRAYRDTVTTAMGFLDLPGAFLDLEGQ